MLHYFDENNKFYEVFDNKTGAYMRSGVIVNGKDSGVDPFMRNFPSLIDVGIMGHCACATKCKVDCYQRAIDCADNPNMTLEDYETLCKQSENRVFSFALGGKGDPDCHGNFEDILKMTRKYNIIPNFTTSGIAFTPEKAKLCKEYCGAVAVSWHDSYYTYDAIKMLLDAGVKTNIHYVLGKNSIEEAMYRLKNGGFPDGINAIVFLLYKPIGLGRMENVLQADDRLVKSFFNIIDEGNFPFKIGFDSCCCPAIVNYTKNIDMQSMDYCEAARHSMYVGADMKAMTCSFCNQDSSYFVDLKEKSIKEAWESDTFNDFRKHFNDSCQNCKDRMVCMGGCPVTRDIILCGRSVKDLK